MSSLKKAILEEIKKLLKEDLGATPTGTRVLPADYGKKKGECPAGQEMVDRLESGEPICKPSSAPPKPTAPRLLKGPGCKPGSKFVGKNGELSGEGVKQIQNSLTKLFGLNNFPGQGFTYKNETDSTGRFGTATENAVLDFQKNYGATLGGKLKGFLGSSLGNPDGCVGPKTACALAFATKDTVLGFNDAKCKGRFSPAKKKTPATDETTVPISGMGSGGQELPSQPNPTPSGPGRGASGAGQPMGESKNWLDRTREETTSNLFERLVKDAAKKVI